MIYCRIVRNHFLPLSEDMDLDVLFFAVHSFGAPRPVEERIGLDCCVATGHLALSYPFPMEVKCRPLRFDEYFDSQWSQGWIKGAMR